MASGQRTVQDCLSLMRVVISRPNENDPASTDDNLLSYLNNFISLKMPNDLKVFEQFGTLTFTIDESNTTGVYDFNDVGSGQQFINLSAMAFISLLDPVDNSVSWNRLPIYQDPGEFFSIWGINNDEILIPGYPTMMLFYGNQFTFRTIPNTSYQVKIYGYKKNDNFSNDAGDENIPYDYWMRYLVYGASLDYIKDYSYDSEAIAQMTSNFSSERKFMLARTHNQAKQSRCMPQF
jgi:hypothetical protein